MRQLVVLYQQVRWHPLPIKYGHRYELICFVAGARYNYAVERTRIDTVAVGKDCEAVPPNGRLVRLLRVTLVPRLMLIVLFVSDPNVDKASQGRWRLSTRDLHPEAS